MDELRYNVRYYDSRLNLNEKEFRFRRENLCLIFSFFTEVLQYASNIAIGREIYNFRRILFKSMGS
jgi:hypothetical protein